MSIVLLGSTSGSVTLQEPAVAGTTVFTLPATSGTVVVTGTTPSLNGITFPATQSSSADANTLDDYEEGTYTMTWTPASGSITLDGTNTRANYTKIGRLVTVSAYAQVSSVSSPTGNLLINLPFASSLVNRGAAGSACLSFNNLDTGGNISYVWSLVDNGDASITVYVGGGATVGGNFSTKIIATTDARITFTYIAAN
jgi:hypothetical protein